MAAIIFILLLLLLLPSLTLSLSSRPPTFSPSELIQKTCNSTSYYDLCINSLCSDPNSSLADVKGLSTIAIKSGITNASNTSSYASGLTAKAADPALKGLLKTCASKYADACDALRWSVDAISTESYDYAFLHVSAAAEYPNVCHLLFRREPRLVYPQELARREEALEHLCTIALEIISLLG